MSQESVLQEVKSKYDQRKLIPFLGAGMSIPFGCPSWTDLIKKLEKDLIDSRFFDAIDFEIQHNEYQKAIDQIKRFGSVNEVRLCEKVAKQFYVPLEDISSFPDNNYKDLATMQFNLFFTTNYDEIFQRHLQMPRVFHNFLDYKSSFQNLLNDKESKYLFQIHGSIADSNTIILSSDSYDKLYSDDHYKTLLGSITATHSFLFMGFSFGDIFIKNEFKKYWKLFKGTHYIITDKDSMSPENIKELVDDYGLVVIEIDPKQSNYVVEIRKILQYLTKNADDENSDGDIILTTHRKASLDELVDSKDKEDNLFYRKLKLANVSDNLIEVSKYFYIYAEIFIREWHRLGFDKKIIDTILASVFTKYKEKYATIYEMDGKTSGELVRSVHEDLEKIEINNLVESIRPDQNEIKGLIHVLADDEEKKVWWGDERFE
ncbi:ABC-three component system protein [Enterococcus canintestini]|uniref:ABC-three component systems C-terminal domain-containing protein n=1 Tax=Enterococcus canintestini TaxID=317010 RepID=A0A267HN57_9ENTE|nr:ABC-three component system protein [Enterococcus canintestini]PAA99818.1 hypothetical protein AKL21_12690 [Enterococcus canintestini]